MKTLRIILICCVLLFFYFLNNSFAEPNCIQVTQIKGLVQRKKLGAEEWLKAEENTKLFTGDKIRSFLESSALLTFPDKSEFRLGENSSLDIKDVSQNPRTKTAKRELKLNLGSLHYKVPPKEETAAEFKIHSSTSIVGITGTEGILTAGGEDKPTENILMEGATFNTDDQGQGGVYQTEGNVYNNDGEDLDIYSTDTQKEAEDRMEINAEYVNLVKELVNKYENKKEEGYNVGDIEPLLEQAFSYLENRSYAKVKEIIEQAEGLLEKAKKLDIPDDLKKKIEALKEQVKNKEAEGFDVSEVYLLLNKIHEQIQEGNFGEIKNIIILANKKLESAIKQEGQEEGEQRDAFLTHYEEIQRLVLEKESKGFSMDEIKSILRQSFIHYESSNLAKSFQLLDEAKDKLQLVLKKVSDSLQQRIDKITEEIETKKEEGYQTEEVELHLEEIKKLLEAEAFLKAQELLAAIGDNLLTLQKGIPADWEVKLNALAEEINYRKSLGYDLAGIYDLIQALEKHVDGADLLSIEEVYLKIVDALSILGLPAGFDADWQAFLKELSKKESQEFDLKEVNDLTEKIKAAIESGDINLARSFLEKAKEALEEIEDTEPPLVQILTFEETKESISIEGFASDNTQVKNVSVNSSLIELSEEGKFIYSTVPASDLKAVTIIAEDIAGNISPKITLELKVKVEAIDQKGEIVDAGIEYLEDSFLVKGKFLPGGKVEVGSHETFCNNEGNFVVTIDPTEEGLGEKTGIVGWNPDGTKTDEVALSVEDKWPPMIEIEKVYFTQNVSPTLQVDPLSYTETSVVVSGSVIFTIMANIEGTVSDLGGQVSLLKVSDREIDFDESGKFLSSFAISPEDISVKADAEDKAGNKSEENVTFDTEFKPPVLKINSKSAVLDSKGIFSQEIFLTKEIKEFIVELQDGEGNQITAKVLQVASILPPELEISDINYSEDKVTITGGTDPQTTVQDKDNSFFTDPFTTSDDGMFTLSANIPRDALEVLLIATNIEGKTSEEVVVKIDPPKDEEPPKLYLSYPRYENKSIFVEGSVEDNFRVASLTIHRESLEVAEDGGFSHEVEMTADLESIDIVVSDSSGNETRDTIVVSDKEPPQLIIDTWEVRSGNLFISGKAQDNIGVREVRLNKRPIAFNTLGEGKELPFFYEGTLTEDSKNAVIIAVDLFDNETQEGPRELDIPLDTMPPQGDGISLEYGSPVVYASGKVNDPGGIKAVYVNGEEIEVFGDGGFNVKVNIDVSAPKITLEAPSYDKGKVTVTGKVAVGDFTPAKITVEAEDLAGNRGVLFSQEVSPYQLNELTIFVDGKIVTLDEVGAFSQERGMVFGQKIIDIKAIDPFDNSAILNLELENTAPFLELNELTYDIEKRATLLSGKATDSDSGLYTILVNGIRIDFDEEGNFSHLASFSEGSLGVVATDYVGNVMSLTKEVKPPDIWPPVFSLEIKPIPAIIGSPVYVEITAIDSRTDGPEMLKGSPIITADIEGNTVSLQVQGEGANYIATLDTDGFSPSLVTIQVEGQDEAGNSSVELEGTNVFTLIKEDTIMPSFTLEVLPDPIELGKESKIKVFASEEIKELPQLEAILPSGETRALDLIKASGSEFEVSLTVPLEEGIGNMVLRLTGGEDLSENRHDITESTVEIASSVQETEIPLNIDLIEFVPDRFTIKGVTASEAVVHIEVGEHSLDIISNMEGKFIFERPITFEELEQMHSVDKLIRVKLRAHNYAGFESQMKVFEVTFPPLPEIGGENFNISINPSPIEQGQTINFNIEVLRGSTSTPQGLLYFPDGQRAAVDLQGESTLTGQYQIPEEVALGTAMFEIVSGTVRESLNFEIVLSSEWMQRLNKDEFFMIRVAPDPIVIGKEAEFIINTMGDLDDPPQLQLMLPDGQVADIPLSGSGRNFQGRYLCPGNVPSGRAEIVLNPGTVDEVRRPFGVEEEFVEGVGADAFLFANPVPLLGGESFEVQVSFSKEVSFKPKLDLKLNDGRGINIPLEGSAPSNKFRANATLPSDVVTGLANFILKDDEGRVIDTFPTHVTPPLTSAKGVDVFVMPDRLQRLDTATIQLNATRTLDEKLEAHISFADGSKIVVPLEGSDILFKGIFTVPDYVPFGIVTIAVFGEDKSSLGTTRAEVIDKGHKGGMFRIFLDNPEFGPGDIVKVGMEAGWPLPFIPKAELNWDGGSLKISLRGKIPGNRFGGEFNAPKQFIERGVIEVKDNEGYVLGEFHIERKHKGDGEVIVTPMPPVIGQPLSIKVIAPSVVDSAPVMRLIFTEGDARELNAYGPIPGDTFTASLDRLENPLKLIEILHEGMVVASIPVEVLNMPPPEFDVDPVGELAPCAPVDLKVHSNVPLPFIPKLSVDFQGMLVDVSLSRMSSNEFLGKLNIPCDASLDNVNAMIFDPQGKLLWQRMYSQKTGPRGGYFPLYLMPSGDNGVDVSWEMIPGVRMYEIRYGQDPGLGMKIEVKGSKFYHVSDLEAGRTYFFQVAAFMRRQEITASDIIPVVVGQTMRELFVQDMIMGNEVQLMWTDYPGADGYRVGWGNAPGAFANSVEVTETKLFVPDLLQGMTYYMKVFALKEGQVIGESRDILIPLQLFRSRGGDIYWEPEPAMQGQDLQVFIHAFDDLPYVPKVVAHLDRGDVSLRPSGDKRDFIALLAGDAFTSRLRGVDVMDPNGGHLFGKGARDPIFPDPSGPQPIFTPDPPGIGQDLNIKVEFHRYPPPFTPRVIVELASGPKEYTFPQGPNESLYEILIPGSDITSSVIRIEIRDPGGMMISERFFDIGPDTFGRPPLMVQPDPPVVGTPVHMTLDVPQMIPIAPKLRVKYTNGSQEEVNMQGPIPGRHFNCQIGTLQFPVEFIDVINPSTGEIKFTWRPRSGPGPSANIMLNCPYPGQPLDVTAEFSQPLSSVPHMFVEFIDGVRKGPYLFPQPPGRSMYSMTIPATEITTSVNKVTVKNDLGLILGENFCRDDSPDMCNIILDFDPPRVGQPLNVRIEFPTPAPFTPKLFVEMENGYFESLFPQGPGLSVYEMIVPADRITSSVMRIGVRDNMGREPCDRPFVGEEPHIINITATPNPPEIGGDVTITVMFDRAPTYTPKWKLELINGPIEDLFSEGPGKMVYEYVIPGTRINMTALWLDILDGFGGQIPGGRLEFEGPDTFTCSPTMVPYPPVPYQDLFVSITYDYPITYTPKVFGVFTSGSFLTPQSFPAMPPGTLTYQTTIPGSLITDDIMRIGFGLDTSTIDCGEDLTMQRPIPTITVYPDPPIPYTDLVVNVEFDRHVPFTPKVKIGFEDTSTEIYPFSQPPGGRIYNMTIPASEITDNVEWIDTLDDRDNQIPPRKYVTAGALTVDITVIPDPPTPATALEVTATFSQNTPFIPRMVIEFANGTRESYIFPGDPGATIYQKTVPATEIIGEIDQIEIKNPTGMPIPNSLFFGDLDDDLDKPILEAVGCDKIDITWPYIPWINEFWIYYGTASGNYDGDDSPVKVSNISSYRLGDFETLTCNNTYYIKIEAYDHNNTLVFTSQEEDIALSSSTVEYPSSIWTTAGVSGEIRVGWNKVAGSTIAGYKVYYGEYSQTYTGTGTPSSPVDITDPNATEAIISGLNDATTYYITVEAYDTGALESNNPDEISTCPGDNTCGGAADTLSVIPSAINPSGNAGSSATQQTVTVSNSAASSARVKFELGNLVKIGGETVNSSNITVAPISFSIPSSGSHDFTIDISIPDGTLEGIYGGMITFYDDANSNSTKDTGEASVDVTVGLTVTSGGSTTLSVTPSAINPSGNAGSSATQQTVTVSNSAASSARVKVEKENLVKSGGGAIISYSNITVSPASFSIPASGSHDFTIDISIPSDKADGLYGGMLTFYDDANSNSTKDTGEASADVTVGLTVTTASADHIAITSTETSSQMGSPVFVTLTAHDANCDIVSSYETSVTITVSESSNGQIDNSWLLSVQDRVTAGGASTGTVGMAQGKGYFSVDALEPETITIGTSGIDNDGTLDIEFTPKAGATLSSFAIDGPSFAITGDSADAGAVFWVSPVDSNGNVITESNPPASATLTLLPAGSTMTKVQGGGVFSGVGPYTYTFVAADDGLARFRLNKSTPGEVTLSETGGTGSNTYGVTFEGVSKFLVFSSGGSIAGTTFSSIGLPRSKTFTIKAALSNNQTVTNYNGSVTWVRQCETGTTSDQSSASSITFSNGTANFFVTTDEYETVMFKVEDTQDSTINTGTITLNFESTDSTGPEVTKVVAETPWLIHIYFSEDVDSTNALLPSNYTGVGTIDKVCWYGDNVTLHLNTKLDLGSATVLTILGATNASTNAIKDSDNNTIQAGDVDMSFSVPNVDYQGAALGGSDWFELQPSDDSPSAGQQIKITVLHKNACGYLTGNNAVNATTPASGSSTATITFGGTASVSGPSSVALSGGGATFTFTVDSGATIGETITISLSDGTVSTLAALSLTVQ